MENYRLGLYEKAMPPTLSWEEKLQCTKEAGFNWLEISIDETEEKKVRLDWSPAERENLLAAMLKTGCPIHTMCLSAHRKYPLGAHDKMVRQQSLEIMEKAIFLATRLGIRIIQLAGYDVYYEDSDEETRAHFCENLIKCVNMAAASGVLLGFETMETSFMDTIKKAMVYVNTIGSAYLGVYPDIGNLTNAAKLYGGNVQTDIATGGNRIFAAHLKETLPGKYRDMDFGAGHTDYISAVRQLALQGVRMFTGEFWYLGQENWFEIVKRSGTFLRQNIKLGMANTAKP